MTGKCFLIVGGTGRGKSTFVKERLEQLPPSRVMVYDINDEYKEVVPDAALLFTGKWADFVEHTQNAEGFVQVYEEATVFLDTRGNDPVLKDILVRKRHTKSTIFLIFHGLSDIPRWVYRLSNYVVLFKTKDNEPKVKQRFDDPDMTELFKRVRDHKEHHYFEMIEIL